MGDLLGGQLSELVTTREWEGNKDGNRRSHTIRTRQNISGKKIKCRCDVLHSKKEQREERKQSK